MEITTTPQQEIRNAKKGFIVCLALTVASLIALSLLASTTSTVGAILCALVGLVAIVSAIGTCAFNRHRADLVRNLEISESDYYRNLVRD